VRDSVHFAAGLAICEAAGCMVTDLRGRVWGSGATGLEGQKMEITPPHLVSPKHAPSGSVPPLMLVLDDL